jgi:hypothetical protein
MDSILKFSKEKLLKVVYQFQSVAKLTNNNAHSTDGYKWTNSPQQNLKLQRMPLGYLKKR